MPGAADPSGDVPLSGLPPQVAAILSDLIREAAETCGDDLVSLVLFGSAADGTLGPTSDVNLLVILKAFAPDRIGRLSDTFLAAEAAVTLRPMFLLAQELPQAAELFAQKFADILRRRRVIHGPDLLAGLTVPRGPEIFRLRQVLLNLALRLRQSSVMRSQTLEQAARILADTLGPLRASAATLLELQGEGAIAPDAALARVAASLGAESTATVAQLHAAHDGQRLDGDPRAILFGAVALAMRMSERSARLS